MRLSHGDTDRVLQVSEVNPATSEVPDDFVRSHTLLCNESGAKAWFSLAGSKSLMSSPH